MSALSNAVYKHTPKQKHLLNTVEVPLTCGQIQEGIQNICKLASPWQDVGQCCYHFASITHSPLSMKISELKGTAAGSWLSKVPGLLFPRPPPPPPGVPRAASEVLGD